MLALGLVKDQDEGLNARKLKEEWLRSRPDRLSVYRR